MRYSIPLEAAVKQGVLEDAWTEPELKVVVICTSAFFGSSEKASVTTKSSNRWSRQVMDKGFMFGFDDQRNGTKGLYSELK
ncbi:hypothetical protein V6N13_149669 [Hibiscus sabdariffa]|uniref:Uncharacterized protein n=1 Tax=Hibiscus sabdariffa TaxID=183260 RepID=A0ABR2EGN6_9ROSI